MLKKYGGVDNKLSLDEIEEAIIYKTPPVRFSKGQLIGGTLVVTAKLFLPVLTVMLLLGGIFVLFGNLSR